MCDSTSKQYPENTNLQGQIDYWLPGTGLGKGERLQNEHQGSHADDGNVLKLDWIDVSTTW